MTKRLAVKIEEYQKDGQTKGKYLDLGVILEHGGSEYLLMDPAINLSGVLQKQNAMAAAAGKTMRTSVMVSVFDGQGQRDAPAQSNHDRSKSNAFQSEDIPF